MINGKRVMVVLPPTTQGGPSSGRYPRYRREWWTSFCSWTMPRGDDTVEVAKRLGIPFVVHPENRGYGGNQKTCYAEALARGADIVIMLHPDYQYSPKLIGAMAWFPACDERAFAFTGLVFVAIACSIRTEQN